MSVIAMTREMGSLGKDVAAGVAERLGLRLMYHEIVDTLAEELHVDRSAVTRLVDGKPNLADRWTVDASALDLFTAEQILDIALQGNVVIRGWGPPTCCGRCRTFHASGSAPLYRSASST